MDERNHKIAGRATRRVVHRARVSVELLLCSVCISRNPRARKRMSIDAAEIRSHVSRWKYNQETQLRLM